MCFKCVRFGDTWDITDFERCELHLDVKESKESNESKEATETMAQLKESLTSQRGLVSGPEVWRKSMRKC